MATAMVMPADGPSFGIAPWARDVELQIVEYGVVYPEEVTFGLDVA